MQDPAGSLHRSISASQVAPEPARVMSVNARLRSMLGSVMGPSPSGPAPSSGKLGQNGLPDGWEARVDPTTGRTFYIDHNTRTTSWMPPVAVTANEVSCLTALVRCVGGVETSRDLVEVG